MARTNTKPNAQVVIAHGRQMGKSHVADILESFYDRMGLKPKIKWQRLPGLKLQAYTDEISARGYERGINESDMDPVQEWSDNCQCGTRMSFNVWQFENEKQITMFLIRWSE